MSNAISIIPFLFSTEWKTLTDVVKAGPHQLSENCASSGDLVSLLSYGDITRAVVICNLSNKDELVQIATFIKNSKSISKNINFKTVVINSTGNRNFEKVLSNLGILDIIDKSTTGKVLKFKIDFITKSLAAGGPKTTTNANKSNAAEQSKSGEKKNQDQIIWRDPIDSEDDVWLIKNPNHDCKKVLGKWLLKIMGPSPYVGQWVEVVGKDHIWRFEFKEKKDLFTVNIGTWYFQGTQKPDYHWKENRWIITGDSFELVFKTQTDLYCRFRLRDKVMAIAQNSEYAKAREDAIIASFDKDVVFAKDKLKLEEMEGATEGELEDYSDIEGKGTTDKIDDKIEGRGPKNPEVIPPDQMAMKNKPEASLVDLDPYSPASEAFKEGKQLDLKNSPTEVNTHYQHQNKNSETQYPEIAEESKSGNPKSDSSESNPYSGIFEEEKKQEKEKTKTQDSSQLPKPHLTSPAGEKLNEGKLLDLKNDTSDLSSHYKAQSHHNPASEKEKKEHDAFQELDHGGHYSGEAKNNLSKNGPDSKTKNGLPADVYDGHLSAPHSGNVHEGKQLDLKNVNSAHQKYYKNHNEAEQYDAVDLPKSKEGGSSDSAGENYLKERKEQIRRERELQEQKDRAINQRDNASNKSSPDNNHIDTNVHSPHSGKVREGQELGLKNTNQSHQTHYKNHNEAEVYDAVELAKERNGFDEGDQGGHYSNLSQDPLKNEKQNDEADYAGKSNTSKLASHYKNSNSKTKDLKSSPSSNAKENSGTNHESNVVPLRPNDNLPGFDFALLNDESFEEESASATVTAVLSSDTEIMNCRLDDYFDQQIIFASNELGLDEVKKVNIDLTFQYLKKNTVLSIKGEIVQVDYDEEGCRYFTVSINSEAAGKFTLFKNLYELRQKNAQNFLKSAKGY